MISWKSFQSIQTQQNIYRIYYRILTTENMTSTAEYAAQKNDCYKKEDKINQRFDQSHIPIAHYRIKYKQPIK